MRSLAWIWGARWQLYSENLCDFWSLEAFGAGERGGVAPRIFFICRSIPISTLILLPHVIRWSWSWWFIQDQVAPTPPWGDHFLSPIAQVDEKPGYSFPAISVNQLVFCSDSHFYMSLRTLGVFSRVKQSPSPSVGAGCK